MYRHPDTTNCSILTAPVVSNSLPTHIDLSAHSLPICGVVGANVWSGVYGADAEAAMNLAHATANACGSCCVHWRTWVQLRDLKANAGRKTKAQVMRTGFLHLDYVLKTFSSELREYALERLATGSHGSSNVDSLRLLKLGELTTRFPIVAQFLLDEYPQVVLVVHKASLIGGDGRPVWTGTVRRKDLLKFHREPRYLEAACPAF